MSTIVSTNPQQNLMQILAYVKDLILDLESESETSESIKNQLISIFVNNHPGFCAWIIQFLKSKDRKILIEILETQFNPEILNFLDETIQKEICNALASHKLAEMLSKLKETEASEILDNLTTDQLKTLLPSFNYFFRKNVEKVLNFPDDSAGKIMDHKKISVPEEWNVGQIKNFIKTEKNIPKYLSTIFLVNKKGYPVGQISLADIIKLDKNSILDNKVSKIEVIFTFLTPINEVVYAFNQYDLYCAPVVDENNVLVGVINISTVLDLAQQAAEENLMYSAGIESSDFHQNFLTSSWNRIRWLTAGTFIATLLSTLMDSAIEPHLLATSTVITSTCGAFGVQVVTIIVNALNNKELLELNLKSTILKEICVAIVVSLVFASIGSMGFYFFNYPISTILVIDLSLIIGYILSATIGVLLPFTLYKLNLDPGLGSGAMLTSITDTLSIFTFIIISRFILNRFLY